MSTQQTPVDDALIRAAGLCGDLRATADVFDPRVRKRDRHLIRQRPHGDFDPDNLMDHLPWRIEQHATEAARTGKRTSAKKAYAAATRELLAPGPQDVTQLPTKVSPQAVARIGAGEDPATVLVDEWRRQVQDLFDTAWAPWRAALAVRAAIDHPLVRVAVLTRHPQHLTDHETLLGYNLIRVEGADGTVAISALVHPAEAEDLLDEREGPPTARLLPSPGVSQARIDTALRMRVPRSGDRTDPPLRCLAATLAAAAGVLGEPVTGAAGDPVTRETTQAALTAMLPVPPKPPRPTGPTPKSTRAHWAGILAA